MNKGTHGHPIRVFNFVRQVLQKDDKDKAINDFLANRCNQRPFFADTSILIALSDEDDFRHKAVESFTKLYIPIHLCYYITDRSQGEFLDAQLKTKIKKYKIENGGREPNEDEQLVMRQDLTKWFKDSTIGDDALFEFQAVITDFIRDTQMKLFEHGFTETDALFVAICMEYNYIFYTTDSALINKLNDKTTEVTAISGKPFYVVCAYPQDMKVKTR